MNDLLTWLFGLDGLSFGDEGVHVGFARPIAGWAWLLIVLGAVLLAGWSYRRLAGERTRRIALSGVRALLLIVIVLVISGPQLVKPNERVEQDWVLVLVDRSASMTIADVGGVGEARMMREAQLERAIERNWPAWRELSRDRTVLWLGFDSGAFDLRASDTGVGLGEPDGRRTALGRALDEGLRRAAARPVSGVVVLSDGRSIDTPSRQALRRLQAERIPVVAIPLGSEEPLVDLAIGSSEAPVTAFLDDIVPVRVRIDRLGQGGSAPAGSIELIEKATGRSLAEAELPETWDGDSEIVTLTAKPGEAGESVWVVRLRPDTPDLILENNSAEVALELVDRPIRVAYFDGYPRWERHYLSTLLLRESSITSSSLMLSANKRFTQEGNREIAGVPRSPEEWTDFDVIVVGDVRPSLLGTEQMAQLREHVAVRGAGLLWIGGPGFTPEAWAETPLGDLLPMRVGQLDSGLPGVTRYRRPVTLARTDDADQLGVLDLGESSEDAGWPELLTDPDTGWSKLYWAQRIEPTALKPTAQVLATAREVKDFGEVDESPAVLSMRYGAGRVIYVATDEIWRWRYGRGEALYERFWLPLIRLQGRESLARSSKPAILEISPRRAVVEQPVRIELRLLDQSLVDLRLQATSVRVRRTNDEEDPGVELRLTPEGGISSRGVSQTFATTWLAPDPGLYTVESIEPLLSGLDLSGSFEVTLPDDELRQPETNHALLETLVAETEGSIVNVSDVDALPDLIRRRERLIAGTPDIATLWDRPIVLIVLVLLLTIEWVGRKLIQLA
jgi:hypothetical protein